MKTIIEAQRAYFESGATLPLECRRNALLSLKKAIKEHESEIMAALKDDLGKSKTEAYMSEIASIYADIDEAVVNLRRWTRAKRISTPMAIAPASSKIVYCPYGVVLIMAPWNYPFLLTIAPMIGALAAGNCCVLKPSELAPATANVVTQILAHAFDVRLVAVVNGGVTESQALLEERFDYIFYTGNTQVGRYVMEHAARHLTPVTLELGGKSPVIVTRSADVRLAARRIAFGKCLNLGQTCVAPDYVLVEDAVHDELIRCLCEEISAMYGAHPLDNPDYGKIINRRHYDRLLRLIDQKRVVYGGQCDADMFRIEPTILDHVEPTDTVMGEEIFGPILPIISVADHEEAFRFVQQRPHPLALYLFTSDAKVESRIINDLQFGGGCVNDTLVHLSNHKMPFGGIGESGMGVYFGKETFLTFSHPKSIVKSPTWIDPKIRYQPFTAWKDKLIHWFM